MIEKAEVKPIDEIFKSYYKIPEYQREYSWKENNWDNLYNDIDESEKEYFLGSLICIIDGGNNFKVVDGQQRLTTLSIFRLAILKKLKDNREYFLNDIVKENKYSNLLILSSISSAVSISLINSLILSLFNFSIFINFSSQIILYTILHYFTNTK